MSSFLSSSVVANSPLSQSSTLQAKQSTNKTFTSQAATGPAASRVLRPESLDGGETSNGLQASLHVYIYDDRAAIVNIDGTDKFDPNKYKYYEGSIICVFKDYRTNNPNPNLTDKWAALRPNPESLWEDILQMNEKAGGTWTTRFGLELEAKLLVALYPELDLNPKNTLQGLTPYFPPKNPEDKEAQAKSSSEKEFPVFINREKMNRNKRTRKLNSLEMEEERAKKAEHDKLMLMNNPHSKKTRSQGVPIDSNKKLKTAQGPVSAVEQSNGIDSKNSRNRIIVKKLRFESEEKFTGSDSINHTMILAYQNTTEANFEVFIYNVRESDYSNPQEYQRFLRAPDEHFSNLKDSQMTFRYRFPDVQKLNEFFQLFTILYSVDHKLKYECEMSINETTPANDATSIDEALTHITTEIGKKAEQPEIQSGVRPTDFTDVQKAVDQDKLPHPVYQYTEREETKEIALQSVQNFLEACRVDNKLKRMRPIAPAVSQRRRSNVTNRNAASASASGSKQVSPVRPNNVVPIAPSRPSPVVLPVSQMQIPASSPQIPVTSPQIPTPSQIMTQPGAVPQVPQMVVQTPDTAAQIAARLRPSIPSHSTISTPIIRARPQVSAPAFTQSPPGIRSNQFPAPNQVIRPTMNISNPMGGHVPTPPSARSASSPMVVQPSASIQIGQNALINSMPNGQPQTNRQVQYPGANLGFWPRGPMVFLGQNGASNNAGRVQLPAANVATTQALYPYVIQGQIPHQLSQQILMQQLQQQQLSQQLSQQPGHRTQLQQGQPGGQQQLQQTQNWGVQ